MDKPPPAPGGDALHPAPGESQFISLARFLMICALVYHHLFELPGSPHSPREGMANYAHAVPEFLNALLHMAAMAAVPILSVISGYLFFRRPRLDFGRLLKRRFLTLALPTWLWSAFWLGLAWGLYQLGAVTAWPSLGWADYGFENAGPMTLLDGIFGLTRQPLAFQFWFVHDLILTLLAAPLIHFFLVRLGWPLLALMSIGWLLIPWPPLLFSLNVPFFFTLGAWLARPSGPGLMPLLRRLEAHMLPLTALFAGALLLRVLGPALLPGQEWTNSYVFLCLLRILGVLALTAVIFRLCDRRHGVADRLGGLAGYSFFIFAAHFPLIELFQTVALRIPGHATALGMLLSWLLIPALTIVTCMAAARAMERALPRLFRLLNGNRATDAGGRTFPAAGDNSAWPGRRWPWPLSGKARQG